MTIGPMLSGVRESCANVFLFKIWVGLQDLLFRMAGSEQTEYGAHGNSDASDAGFTPHDFGVESNSVECWHSVSSSIEEGV